MIFFVGFYPFQWVPPFEGLENGARIEKSGLGFPQPGLFKDDIPPVWLAEVKKAELFSIDIELSPVIEQLLPQTTIVALAVNRLDRSFAIEQDGKGLLVWLRYDKNNLKGQPYFTDNVFVDAAKWYSVKVKIEAGVLSVWVDGDLFVRETFAQDGLSFWADDHRLSVGNELTGERPWLGDIRRMAVLSANREDDLLHSSSAYIPASMRVAKGAYFTQLVPFIMAVNADTVADWAVNFFGFIPVGAFVALSLGRKKLLGAVLFSAFLSFSVETGQQFIAERTTQADDFILNTLGGMFGATLLLFWHRLRQK